MQYVKTDPMGVDLSTVFAYVDRQLGENRFNAYIKVTSQLSVRNGFSLLLILLAFVVLAGRHVTRLRSPGGRQIRSVLHFHLLFRRNIFIFLLGKKIIVLTFAGHFSLPRLLDCFIQSSLKLIG